MKTTYRKSCAPNVLVGSDLPWIPASRSNVVLDTNDGPHLVLIVGSHLT